MRGIMIGLAAALALAAAPAAHAQTYPAKPIRIGLHARPGGAERNKSEG